MTSSATVVFLNLPPKTFVGVNLASFDSSPNFHGITNLPSGIHFVYTGTDASLSIRHGIWLKIPEKSARAYVLVLRWSKDHEHLEELDKTHDEAQRIVRELPRLQKRGMVDYVALQDASTKLQKEQSDASNGLAASSRDAEEESSNAWPPLTSQITSRLLTRILSAESTSSRTAITWTLTSISSAPSDTEHIPGLTETETQNTLEPLQTLSLLPVDLKKTWPDSAQGRTRTDMARDRSWYLSHLVSDLRVPDAGNMYEHGEISQARAAKELLGELQFCFLMVLCLANYSCLEQWKRILSVLFTCRTALLEAETYFVEAIRIFRNQLSRVEDVEGGLFELADEASSAWLRKLLKTFRLNVDEVYADADDDAAAEKSSENENAKATEEDKKVGKQLTAELDRLEVWLREQYGWEDEKNVLRKGMIQLEDGEMVELQHDDLDEDEETGEYAPVVVDV